MKELEYTSNYCGCDIYTASQLLNSPTPIDGLSLAYTRDLIIGGDHYKYRIMKNGVNSFTTTQSLENKGIALIDWIIDFKSKTEE